MDDKDSTHDDAPPAPPVDLAEYAAAVAGADQSAAGIEEYINHLVSARRAADAEHPGMMAHALNFIMAETMIEMSGQTSDEESARHWASLAAHMLQRIDAFTRPSVEPPLDPAAYATAVMVSSTWRTLRKPRPGRLHGLLGDFAAGVELDIESGALDWGSDTVRAEQRIADYVEETAQRRADALSYAVGGRLANLRTIVEHETNGAGNREALALIDEIFSILPAYDPDAR